ncbi:MAG: phosphatase PAP2 family protein [Terracidiphilus sp.]
MQIRPLRLPRAFATTAFVLLLGLSAAAHPALAQSPTSQPANPQAASSVPPNAPEPHVTLRDLPHNLLHDQADLWTSPARLRGSNIAGPAALVLGTTLLITTDHQVMSSALLNNPSLNQHAVTASNGLIGGFLAAPAVFYGLGRIHHDDHAAETGILAGEAIGDSLAVNEVLKIVSLRERPTVDNARGRFFQTVVGFNSSFPSNHAILAWSTASVIASEYPGILTKITAYGLATGVSVARVVGREHFPSDVLVGSALGWMIGRYVFHRHSHGY